MAHSETVLPFSPSPDVARCLRTHRAAIMARWDRAARDELAPARHQSKPALYDELPDFLEVVAQGLESVREACHVQTVKQEKATSHGEERAKAPEYTLEQMLFEYHLLRDEICDTLENEVRLSAQDRAYIHASIDEAMRFAAQRFADFRLSEEQRGVARLELEREMRERFVATLTHDLRTPLTAILTSSQLILRQADLPETCVRLASRIVANLDRADRMIQDLLDANLIQAGGQLPLQCEAGELRAIVQEAIDEITSIHGNRFTLRCAEPIPGFWCRQSLRRAVENLLQNAIKYGEPNGEITVKLAREEMRAIITVQNFGNPVPLAEQASLFRQFRRASSAQISGKKGWGLGLTLVRGVAEAHGGTASMTSSPEDGTVFTITLLIDPRARAGSVG